MEDKINFINRLPIKIKENTDSVHGIDIKRGSKVSLYSSGKIASVILNRTPCLEDFFLKEGTTLYFHPNSEVLQGILYNTPLI